MSRLNCIDYNTKQGYQQMEHSSPSWDAWVEHQVDTLPLRDWKPSAADRHIPDSVILVMFAASSACLVEILIEMVPPHSLDRLGVEFAEFTENPVLFQEFSRARASVAARKGGADVYADSRRLSIAEAKAEREVAQTIFVYLSVLADPDGFGALKRAIMTPEHPVPDGRAAAQRVFALLTAGTSENPKTEGKPRLQLVGTFADFMAAKQRLAHLINAESLAEFR